MFDADNETETKQELTDNKANLIQVQVASVAVTEFEIVVEVEVEVELIVPHRLCWNKQVFLRRRESGSLKSE